MPKNTLRLSWKRMATWVTKKTQSLTLYEQLSLVISFFGALSLVFIFVQTFLTYRQTRQTTEQMQASTEQMQASIYATLAEHTFAIDRVFMENPALRPYFYKGQEIKEGDKDYDLVMSTAEFTLDAFDAIEAQLDYLPNDQDTAEDRATWKRYFADSFAHSPALCNRLKKNEDWYMERLRKAAESSCK